MQRLEMLARYKAWANERLYATLAGISDTDLAAPSPIFAGSILRTLNHVYLMDVVWKSHLLGVPHGLTTRNPEATSPLLELRGAQREIDAWYIDYAAAMTPDTCDEVVHFTFIGGGEGTMRREDILLGSTPFSRTIGLRLRTSDPRRPVFVASWDCGTVRCSRIRRYELH